MSRTSIQFATLIALGAGTLVVGSVAHGQLHGARGGKAVVVKLHPKNGSGISGTATLIPAVSQLRVVVKLGKPVEGYLPVHIHTGSCKHEPTWSNPRLKDVLDDVVDGKSDTTVADTLETLQHGIFSINVHKQDYPNRAIACGDIPRV